MADWKITGEYMESCNCDYLCPCIYTNPQEAATNDNCYAMMLYHIEEGQFGDTNLDDQTFAFVIRSGKVMADGDWIFGVVVDEKADEDQRQALSTIVSGKDGGVPAMLHEGVVGDFRGVEFHPVIWEMDGLKRSVTIPEVFSFEIEGVTSRNFPDTPLHLENTSHPANDRLALARASSLQVKGFGLDLEMTGQGNNGHFAPFSWSN